jgi:hypothetical protein
VARKLTDTEVGRLRELWAEGWSAIDLAAEFDVSRQHVGRLVREEQQPAVAGLDPEALQSGVAAAVDAFLADLELGPGDAAMAAVARTLAAKLDACAATETAAAAAAIPRLSSELVEVLDRCAPPPYRGPTASTSCSRVARRDAWRPRPTTVRGISARSSGLTQRSCRSSCWWERWVLVGAHVSARCVCDVTWWAWSRTPAAQPGHTQPTSGGERRCQGQPVRAERSEPRSGGLDCRRSAELVVVPYCPASPRGGLVSYGGILGRLRPSSTSSSSRAKAASRVIARASTCALRLAAFSRTRRYSSTRS